LLTARRREGDIAGIFLMGMGTAIYLTELWRDLEGRGEVLNGALDGPQVAAVTMVLMGAWKLREQKESETESPLVSGPAIEDTSEADTSAGAAHE